LIDRKLSRLTRPLISIHNTAPPVPRIPARLDKKNQPQKGNLTMLMTIAIILLVLWAFGLLTSYTMGGFIHILIVVAIIIVLVRVIQGRRVL